MFNNYWTHVLCIKKIKKKQKTLLMILYDGGGYCEVYIYMCEVVLTKIVTFCKIFYQKKNI